MDKIYKRRPLSNREFIKTVKQNIEQIKETENYNQIGKAFDFWVLKNYFELDEETVATNIIESPNDKRVDAFVEEEENIKIIQYDYLPKTNYLMQHILPKQQI